MCAIRRILLRPKQHNVNMNTALTTFDGYPRADIDVAQIRTTRARIVRLKNDHKALMAKLDVVVQEAFAKGAQQSSSAAVPSTSEAQPTRSLATPVPTMEAPFAKVNTVVPNSPAESAGLKAGDRITKFGSANFTNHERLAKVAQVVQQSENVSLRQP